jgi:hypothetical protein
VGQNALRHGLSVAVLGDVALSQEVEAVARKIAGNSASAASIDCARRIAEAEVDLRRVRRHRNETINRLFAGPGDDAARDAAFNRQLDHFTMNFKATALALQAGTTWTFIPFKAEVVEGPAKLGAVLNDLSKTLNAFDRYETRALSRRKFAIRAYDAIRAR